MNEEAAKILVKNALFLENHKYSNIIIPTVINTVNLC
jgi:hypothetical protein